MQNARLYSLVGGVLIGTCITSSIAHDWCSAVIVCLGFVDLGIVSFFVLRYQKTKLLKKTDKSFSLSVQNEKIFIIFLIGIALGAGRVGLWMSFNYSNVPEQTLNKKISILATVIEEPQMSDGSSKIIVKTLPNIASGTSPTKMLITADRYSTVEYGDEIKLFGKIVKPKPIKSDEGNFAYDVYLARQGIFYIMVFPNISIVSHHQENIFREYLIKIKNNFLRKIDELFVAPKSGLLAGLLVSGRSSLSKVEQAMFTQAGLIHIVALSGFNVTIIAQGLMTLLIFLPKKLRLIIGAVGILAFVIMTGFSATVVRAGIMALLVIFAALIYRTYHVGRALFMTVLFMALWNPMVVFDVSFQLSCIATFAVIFSAPSVVLKYGSHLKFLPETFKIREIMLSTFIIELYLLPILLSTSGQISLVTVVTNLLILPTLPVVMSFGFAATLVGYVHSLLALPLVVISNLMLEYILLVANFFSNIPFGVLQFQIPEWGVAVIYIVLGFWLWRLQKFQSKNSRSTDSPLTLVNLERLDNFFLSHSNSNFQKKR